MGYRKLDFAEVPASNRPIRGTHDYYADVPVWTYRLTCGHEVQYVERVPLNGYGICQYCPIDPDVPEAGRGRTWRHTHNTAVEIPPLTPKGKHYAEDALVRLVDKAALKQRAAHRQVEERFRWEQAKEFASLMNAEAYLRTGITDKQFSATLIREVLSDMGEERPDSDHVKGKAAGVQHPWTVRQMKGRCSRKGCSEAVFTGGRCAEHYAAYCEEVLAA